MKHYFDLVWYKTYADLRVEASRGYLGILWWILEPLLYMTVFYIVFGILFQRGGEGYVAFLLTGLVAWRWFDNTLRMGANSIIANRALIQQVYVPKIIFPTVTIVTNTVKFLVVLSLLLLFIIFYGSPPTLIWLLLPLLLAIQLILILSVTWFLSAVVPLLPDLRIIIDSGLTLMFFMSGIFFDIESLPMHLADYLRINPMAILIESYRKVLIDNILPDWSILGFVILFSLILMAISFRLHIRLDKEYTKIGLV